MNYCIKKFSNKLYTVLNDIKLPQNPAIVFDIDNTLIYINGEPISPIINFFNHVKRIGINVILITNRSGDNNTVNWTMKQLKQR